MYILPHFHLFPFYPSYHSFNYSFLCAVAKVTSPYLVLIISFSEYQVVCVSTFPRSTYIQSSISLLHCPLSVCNTVLVSVPNFYSFIFPYVMGCVILHFEFHCFSADFMFIWSLLVLVILPDWAYSFKFIVS